MPELVLSPTARVAQPELVTSPVTSPSARVSQPTEWDSTNWDLNVQQPHGGQEWSSLDNFVEDFSVTTNFMGPPWRSVAAASASLQHMDHYPAANCEPAVTDLAKFLNPAEKSVSTLGGVLDADLHARLMLGNGASELIDLVTRICAPKGSFTLRSSVQYKEYERAAKADGREMVAPETVHQDKRVAQPGWAMLAVINPCNPTGEYLNVDQLKDYIEKSVDANIAYLNETSSNASAASTGLPGEHLPSDSPRLSESEPYDRCTVLVDESMQLWRGEDWRSDSLVSQAEWIKRIQNTKNCSIFLIHSWTKIWSCPGIRLGSILCPTAENALQLKQHQVPWSLNVAALAFLSSAVMDKLYLQQTWQLTLSWRKETVIRIQSAFPNWEIFGEPWLSWLWIDTKSESVASQAVTLAKAAGTPIRAGGLGYNQPTMIRIAVRAPDKQVVLFKALAGIIV